MKTKLRQALADKTKDYGLSKKALDELVDIGLQGLSEDATDDDITKCADSIAPFAKAMQGEVTRKLQKTQSKKPTSSTEKEDEEDGENNVAVSDVMPAWFTPFQQKLEALENENATLKAAKAKAERAAAIADEAKKLGIPDYLMRRVSFADDADFKKELADYKQELVNNNLMPKASASIAGTSEEAMKADAKAWAESLPSL